MVALQGRFDEARQIASQDSTPQEAEANIAYIRQMIAPANSWNKIKQADKKLAGEER